MPPDATPSGHAIGSLESLPVWEWVGQVVASQRLSGLRYWLVVMTAGDPCRHALLPTLTSVSHSLPQAWTSATAGWCDAVKANTLASAVVATTLELAKLGCLHLEANGG